MSDEYKVIGKFKKAYQPLKAVHDAVKTKHHELYSATVNEVLGGDDGTVDLNKLEDKDTRGKFVDTFMEKLRDAYKEQFKIGDIPDAYQAIAQQHAEDHFALSRDQLSQAVESARSSYDAQAHLQTMGQAYNALDQKLRAAASAHITQDDIGTLLDEIKVGNSTLRDKLVTPGLSLQEARQLVNVFVGNNYSLSDDVLVRLLGDKVKARKDPTKQEKKAA